MKTGLNCTIRLPSDIDIGGYHLSDKIAKPTKWVIPQNTVIPAGGYLVFWCSDRDTFIDGHYHTNFKLTQTKGNEDIVFSDPNGVIIESYPYALTLLGHSRVKDLTGQMIVNISPDPGGPTIDSTFQGYTSSPNLSLDDGFYDSDTLVTIAHPNSEVTIRYTTDGTLPTASSTVYTDPISITETTVVKARAFSNFPDILPGKIAFSTYFIDETFTLAVLSVAADDVQNLANGNGVLRPIGSIEYFNVNKERTAVSYGELNRHGQDSWQLPHRSLDWVSRDEMGYNKDISEKLFSYSDRDNYQRIMMRASGDDNYPAVNDFEHEGSTHIRDEYVHTLALEGNMKLDIRAVERCIVFLNGDYWGVYGLRERPVDHDYTSEYYNQGKYDLHYLLTWGRSWAEYGGEAAFEDWAQLREFILNQDMSDSANYKIVTDQFQSLSLIDYMIANLNSVAQDWINYNTGWWRGTNPEGDHKKWGYILWDNDATFDYYINYTPNPKYSTECKAMRHSGNCKFSGWMVA